MRSQKIKAVLFLIITLISSVFIQADNKVKNLTAHRSAGELESLDLASLPTWTNSELRERYREIRDKKFLTYEGEQRRIPWLFARDGCHVRATHFILEAQRQGYTTPKRIFIFGALEMRGAIIPKGAVQPWFHAAPIIQVDGEAMVLDPSVSFSRPLPLKTWIDYVAKDKSKVIYSICEENTYLPTTSCKNPGQLDMERLGEETQLFLKFEKNILKYLGLSFN